MCVSSVGFAWQWGVLRGVLGEHAVLLFGQTDALTMYIDWEVRRLGMRDTLKLGTITVSGFGYFHKNCRFLWEKNVSKTKGSTCTIHYTYTSYKKKIPTLYGFRGVAAQ